MNIYGSNEVIRPDCRLTRRNLLAFGLVAFFTKAVPSWAYPNSSGRESARSLSFYQTHTGEKAELTYWADGGYIQESLQAFDHILRDHYSGEVLAMDRKLFDFLFSLRSTLDTSEPFHIISGYRSAETNARLRIRGRGVARHSLHMRGMALDLRVPGRDLAVVRNSARKLRLGGVGYYPESNFVHVDVGRIRSW